MHDNWFHSKGWSTWYIGDMLSHLYLPQGFGITLGIYDTRTGQNAGHSYFCETTANQ